MCLKCIADLLDEAHAIAHIQEYAVKQKTVRRYNSRVIPMDIK